MLDSNNSNLFADSIIRRVKRHSQKGRSPSPLHEHFIELFIEHKSCQINKINAVPISIIFKQGEIVI